MFKKINGLFLFQIITHLSIIPMIIYGELSHYLLAWFVFFLTGSIGMSATFHRLLSHKSYIAPKWWEYFGTICATLGGTGSSIAWCAVHREHHRFTDTEKDPHSPQCHGVLRVQFLSMFHYPQIRYVPDLLRSNFHIMVHKYYWHIHLLYAVILYTVLGPFALIYLWLFPCLILWHAGSSINTLSHLFGKQDHKTNDTSTNHWLTGIFVWGEGWHNNHHWSPTDYQFGKRWYQIDITYWVIRLLGFKPRTN